MNGIIILLIAIGVLVPSYIFYGGFLSKVFGIDKSRITPARRLYDGCDYAPAPKGVVFGHQFASIAGAGPINGPILAAMFGWFPAFLWILIGGVFIGGAQDFASMHASVRNDGKTIGSVIEKYLGRRGKLLFLIFIWLFSMLVIAAFADIVAGTFDGFDSAGNANQSGGSVAMTSIMFIAAAVAFGIILKKAKNLKPVFNTLIAIGMIAVCIVVGLFVPVYLESGIWMYIIFAYIFAASVMPVAALLQPRDYLSSYLLIFMIIAAVVGIFFSNPEMSLPAFTGFEVNGNFLFPAMFITIACGAVSGFHSLVSSGTASKQVMCESHIKPVSYGAMLIESLLAVLAIIAVGALSTGGVVPSGTPPVIFATAVAGFLTNLGLPADVVYTLITLAISAFALTTLDSVLRIGRMSFEEIFTRQNQSDSSGTSDGINAKSSKDAEKNEKPCDTETTKSKTSVLLKILTNKYFSTSITLAAGFALALIGYQNIWPLFGSANQLLAALALLACALYLKNAKRKSFVVYIPMIVMLAITFSALGVTLYKLFTKIPSGAFTFGDGLQTAFAVALTILGIIVAIAGIYKLLKKEPAQVLKEA